MESRAKNPRFEKPVYSQDIQTLADSPLTLNLSDLSWEDFELLVGELFRRRGWQIEMELAHGPDGGTDVRLRRGDELALVQCKHWSRQPVGVSAIREFFGVLVSEGAQAGFFVASGTFSRDAREFASGKFFELIDGAALGDI